MALRTATVAGNWSTPATWGGTAPVPGDTVQINVAVTLDVNADIGTSGAAGSVAGTVAATGKLTIADGKTLTVRGDLVVTGTSAAPLSNVRIEMGAGSVLVFDGTAASAGVQYRFWVGAASSQPALLRVRGTQASHAVIKSNVAGGALPAYQAGILINQSNIDAEWLDFIDFGDATQNAWKPYMGSNANNYVRMVDCTFTRCGKLGFGTSIVGGTTFDLTRVKWYSTVATRTLTMTGTAAIGAGVRRLVGCCFDLEVELYSKDFTIESCVFERRFLTLNGATPWASFKNNFFRNITSSGMSGAAGDMLDCFYLEDSGTTNPHGPFLLVGYDAPWTVDGLIIESVTGGAGDFLVGTNPGTPRLTTIKNCILLPSDPSVLGSGSYAAGKLMALLGGANMTVSNTHNTVVVSDGGETGNNVGETYAGHAGMISEFKSNLIWRPTPGTAGYKLTRIANTVQDIVAAANADYNWGWNLAAGNAGNGYHAAVTTTPMFSTGTPDVHGGNGDPQFVDWTRNLEKWAVTRGSTATTDANRRADGIAFLKADPTLIADLIAYVRAGFAPTNPAMEGAAHDAASPTTLALGTPGAVAYAGAEELPPPTLYVYDTFSGPAGSDLLDHVGQVGASWSRHPAISTTSGAGWTLAGTGRAYCSKGGFTNPAHVLASGVSPTVDYDVVARWRWLGFENSVTHGVVFRYDPAADSGYRLVYQTADSRRWWAIHKVVNGSATSLGNFPQPLVVGADYEVRVKLRAGTIEVLVDGVTAIGPVSDATYAATPGRVGLYGNGDSTAGLAVGIHLDVLAVAPPDGGLPDYDLDAPPRGVPGLASPPFAVTLAPGVNPGTATFTPSADGIAGTFTPPSLTLTDATRSGTFTFTQAGSTPGSGTIAVAAGVAAGLVPPPAVAYATGYGPPSRLEAWRSRVHATYHTGPIPFVLGTGFEAEYAEHWDPMHSIMSARDYCVRTDLPPTDWSVELSAEVTRYRDRYVIPAGGNFSWVHRYTPGLAGHYRETGDPLSAQAIDLMLPLAGSNILNLLQPARHEIVSGPIDICRPAAWQLIAMLDREWCGLGPHPLTDSTAKVILGHCDIWTGVTPRFGVWNKPFMTGLSLRALIAYWDRYKDATEPTRAALVARIPGTILAVLEYLWTTSVRPDGDANWPHTAVKYQYPASVDVPRLTGLTVQSVINPVSTFTGPASLSTVDDFYKFCSVVVDGDNASTNDIVTSYVGATRQFTVWTGMGNHNYAAGATFYISSRVQEPTNGDYAAGVVNPQVSPAYAWAYWYCERVLGDHAAAVVHRDRHDRLFDGQASSWNDLSEIKQWNQVWQWGAQWDDWRDRGDAEWPVATAFTLQAPATGAAGPHSVKSGPFRLSIPRGVRLDAPAHVTPASSSGRGTFAPADAILTTDRPTAMFTFTPSSIDDGTTVGVSATASGLAGPAPIAYAVGSVMAAFRRTFRVGPRFDRNPTTRSALVR